MIALQVVVGGLLLGAVYALFSSGLTLVWGMMNVVNFAHGDFVMLGMYIAYLAVVVLHAGPLTFTLLAAVAAVSPRGGRLLFVDPAGHARADARPDPVHLWARAR